MSRQPQDQVIDEDEDELCPLCIEEFDMSDKLFYPCPCGFQICQFCHNKIKTQGNCLCPACRRPYDDKNIKWKAPSSEETAEHKARQAKKKVIAKQKEVLNREADTTSRKHLAGIRVRRQNLVYVTGLKLNVSDSLNDQLRGEQFFGQYGRIDKIVVSKSKESPSLQPVGVYVTYFDKAAAAMCIAMVNGTQNAGGTVRADYGTTKYCSAYLRNETCTNRNCTFLHEAGEENESFTREDLSSLNASSIQSSSHQNAPSSSHPPSQQSTQAVHNVTTAVAHAMDRQDSRDGTTSPVDSSDGSALPSTASWANKNALSRRPSQAASFNAPSPLVSNAILSSPIVETVKSHPVESVPTPSPEEPTKSTPTEPATQTRAEPSTPRTPIRPLSPSSIAIRKFINSPAPNFVFDESALEEDPAWLRQFKVLQNHPPLFGANGGAKRHLLKNQEFERRRFETDQQVNSQAFVSTEMEEATEGGSFQLGGEPEDRQSLDSSQQHVIRPPSQNTVASFDQAFPSGTSLNGRSIGPQQQQQFLLQQLKSASPLGHGYGNQGSQTAFNAPPIQPGAGSSGHSRQTSRFSFANESSSASASIKPVANAKLMTQQSSMMPPQINQQFDALPQHQSGSQFFPSGVQGPPPGLKATGTPPVSGGGMFGQGHGFATAGLSYGVNANGRTANDEMLRDLLRSRGGSTGSGRTSDGGRHDIADPSILQARMQQASGVGQGIYGAQSQGQGGSNSMMHSVNNGFNGRW